MQVVHGLEEVHAGSRSCVTIGVFDGVHRGHQRILKGMVEEAESPDCTTVAVTFDPHPAAVLGDNAPPLLTTMGERMRLMAELGLDVLVVFPFTEDTASTSAADFVESLVRHLGPAQLWVGPDFTLGHRREGNVSALRRLGEQHGFTVRVAEPVVWGGGIVHSSRVRDALQRGDVEEATGCLGRPYRLAGVVIHGRGLGQDIGVPSANISPPPSRLIPAKGVYACLAQTERWGTHPAATNVGVRPTFAGQELTVEAHLLDFEGELYSQVLALDFIARLRDERVYSTLNALVAQLHKDVAQTRAVLGKEEP